MITIFDVHAIRSHIQTMLFDLIAYGDSEVGINTNYCNKYESNGAASVCVVHVYVYLVLELCE